MSGRSYLLANFYLNDDILEIHQALSEYLRVKEASDTPSVIHIRNPHQILYKKFFAPPPLAVTTNFASRGRRDLKLAGEHNLDTLSPMQKTACRSDASFRS